MKAGMAVEPPRHPGCFRNVMDYADIFHFPPWEYLALSSFQAATIFCLILVGLKIVGRRVFAQRGPQDLIIIVLVAETCDMGLSHEQAGYWGSVFSVLTLFALGYLCERIPLVRRMLDEEPVILYKNGKLNHNALKRHMIDEDDLDEVAREEGYESYKNLAAMMLEGDGRISALPPRKRA